MFSYQTVDGAVGQFSVRTRIEEAAFLSQQRGFNQLRCISELLSVGVSYTSLYIRRKGSGI